MGYIQKDYKQMKDEEGKGKRRISRILRRVMDPIP